MSDQLSILNSKELLTPKINQPLQEWFKTWTAQGVPPSLLDSLAIHLLSTETPAEEFNQMCDHFKQIVDLKIESIRRHQKEGGHWRDWIEPDGSTTGQARIPSRKVLIDAAVRQKRIIKNQSQEHEFLRMIVDGSKEPNSKPRDSCRAALESIVGYKADERRQYKADKTLWCNLLAGVQEKIALWLRETTDAKETDAKEKRKRLKLLLDALTGDSHKRLGLTGIARDLYTIKSRKAAKRRLLIDEQARVRGDGKKVPVASGMRIAVALVAGDISEEEARHAGSDSIEDRLRWAGIQRRRAAKKPPIVP